MPLNESEIKKEKEFIEKESRKTGLRVKKRRAFFQEHHPEFIDPFHLIPKT